MALSCKAGEAYSDINMTPLIDVMLVLLIIFIITIPAETHAVKIDNPAGPAWIRQPELIDIFIDFDGALLWNQQPIDRVAMQRYISQVALKFPQPEIRISVDKFAKYEIVAQTLADLQRKGLKAIGFVRSD